MTLNKIFKNVFLAVVLGLVLSACAQQVKKVDSQIQGDVYTGTDTVEYLAAGVPDRGIGAGAGAGAGAGVGALSMRGRSRSRSRRPSQHRSCSG